MSRAKHTSRFDAPFAQRLSALIAEKKITHAALAQEIKELAKSQPTLAENFRISRQLISQYTKGETQPSVDKLCLIAEFFHVSTDYLLGRVDVSTTDTTLRQICERTGLSEKAINQLLKINSDYKDASYILNQLLEHDDLREWLLRIHWHSSVKHYRNASLDYEILEKITEAFGHYSPELPEYLENISGADIGLKIMKMIEDFHYIS